MPKSKTENQKHSGVRSGAVLCLAIVACAGLIVYARSSHRSRNAFALAKDLPRGAVVYAQFSDLPAFIKRWDESKLKGQYLESENFKQFTRRHLALKLLSRWQEFNDALGFELDTAAIGSASENQAAIAVYDIGRLDIIFIAPISDEGAAATLFFHSKDRFEETTLPDGTTYYRHDVEADRGRQKQQIAFAIQRGRFLLATNEQLLLRALANINNRSPQGDDRLANQPSFKALSSEVEPHFATVWTDQARLNDDWYFKHYWALPNVEQLKTIRAGIFDVELQAGRLLEHRDFLLSGQEGKSGDKISTRDAERISALMPPDAPYFKMETVNNSVETASDIIRDTLFDRSSSNEQTSHARWNWQSYGDEDFAINVEDESEWDSTRYTWLDSNYNASIDDPVDAKVVDDAANDSRLRKEAERDFAASLQRILQAAHPSLVATAESPRASASPLFADFRRISVLTLRAPAALDEQALAQAIAKAAQSRLMIAGAAANLHWTDEAINNQTVRRLDAPMLGWQLSYARAGTELIFANNLDLLREALSARSNRRRDQEFAFGVPIDEITTVRFDRQQEVFDGIVNQLDPRQGETISDDRKGDAQSESGKDSEGFFSGNIASLLNLASHVSEVTLRRSTQPNRLHEEIEIDLK